MNWIEELLALDRPEYVGTPEALLTDLFWRSDGSSISSISLKRHDKLARLIPERRNRQASGDTIETASLASGSDIGSVISHGDTDKLLYSLLNSIRAPQSRKDKSTALVPVFPDIIVFQTLAGLVNKSAPANVAKIIETIAWLGGSPSIGHVARPWLECVSSSPSDSYGLNNLVERIMPQVANHVWAKLIATYPTETTSAWPNVTSSSLSNRETANLARLVKFSPFTWLWEKWNILCQPMWYESLPPRRFVDWSTCLLRTGLAFAYLWEAKLFFSLFNYARYELDQRANKRQDNPEAEILASLFDGSYLLGTIESSTVAGSQKHSWNALSTLLINGYVARRDFKEKVPTASSLQYSNSNSLIELYEELLNGVPQEELVDWVDSFQPNKNLASSVREFVRYLLLPRSSDDDTTDQADFYYFAKANSRNFWFEPGPEWLVVVTALLADKPGGECTLGMLMQDFRKLGIRVDRRILVEYLENAGLTSDSPDADNALVIRSGF